MSSSTEQPIIKVDNLPTKAKAQVYTSASGKIEYKEVEVPTPKPTEILVNVLYSGVCHTDLHVWKDDLDFKSAFPRIGGHEGVGRIAAMGADVKGFKLGELVGVKVINYSCGSCEMCQKGYEPNCDHTQITGLTMDGTFAEYAIIDAPEVTKIPEGTNQAEVAPFLCAGLTAYKAVKTSGLRTGEFLAISGACGGLGTLAIQYAKAMGYRVLALDVGDKEKLAKELGAEMYIDVGKLPDDKAQVEAVQKATNGGPHGVIVLAASERCIRLATDFVRTHGIVVLVCLPREAQIKANVFATVYRGITIKGSYVGTRNDMQEALEFYTKGLVKANVRVEPLSKLPEIFEALEKGQVTGRIVVEIGK